MSVLTDGVTRTSTLYCLVKGTVMIVLHLAIFSRVRSHLDWIYVSNEYRIVASISPQLAHQ